MNRFSRIRHHVDMRDVKEKCLHEIVVKKIKEEKDRKEKNIIQEISKKYKSNWRNELDEGMTVAGFVQTTLPAEGDEALVDNNTKNINDGTVPYPLNPSDANALPGVSDIFAPGPANVIDPNGKGDAEGVPYGTASGGGFGGGQIWASSTEPYGSRNAGTIENSGFDMGGPYARLYSIVGGPQYGTIPYRYLTLASTDTTELSHLRITAIQGNATPGVSVNGGMGGWDINGAKEQASIRVRYWVPGMSDFQYLSINPQGQTTRGQFDQDQLNPTDVIVPYDANASFPTNFLIDLPEYARGKDVRFQLYQKATVQYNIFYGQHWGVSNISYQRRTPISVAVFLDDPAASSFVRVGQGTKKSSPKKRKKRVEDILSAGKEYTNKYLGSDFPGSSTELSPETSPEVSSVDQEIADVQQQKRDSMSQQTKDEFRQDKQGNIYRDTDGGATQGGETTLYKSVTANNKIKVPDFSKFDNYDDARAAYDAARQSYEAALASAVKEFGRELYRFEIKAAQSNWDNFEKNRPGGPFYPRPQFDSKRSEELANTDWLRTTVRITGETPAGRAIQAIFDRGEEINNAYFSRGDDVITPADVDDAEKIQVKGVNPQAEPVKDEGGEDEGEKDDKKFLEKQQTLVNLTKFLNHFGLPNDFAQWTINYAKGDMTPITKFSPGMQRQIRDLVLDKFKKNPNAKTVSIQYSDYGYGFKALPTRLGLGRFNATKLPNGKIRIQDTFNVNKDFTNIGSASIIPGLQKTADRLVDISYKNRNIKGREDKGGIKIDVEIEGENTKDYTFNRIKNMNRDARKKLSLDEPIVTSPRSSKKSKKKNKEG